MQEWFYGIRGIEFVWHGAWNDPGVIWRGHSFNYYDLEDTLWSIYSEECDEAGKVAGEDDFIKWVKSNAYLAYDILQNILDSEEKEKEESVW